MLAALAIATSARADHPCDEAGSAPTATIEHDDKIIEVGGQKVTGSGVIVQLTAEPEDKDLHKDSPSATGSTVADTFSASGAIEWSQSNFNGTFSSPNSLTTSYTTTTANGSGSIKLKIKDDGTHYKDLSDLTEKATLDLLVAVPDGARITSQSPSWNATTRYMATAVEIQVTYQNHDLPWVGHLAEKFKESSKFNQVVNGTYSYDAGGSEWWGGAWNTGGDYGNQTTQEGKLQYDNHTNPGVPVLTVRPSYVDLGGRHTVGFVRPSNSSIAQIQIFQDEEYLMLGASPSSVETPVHNEH